jgi:hypothetical protein
LNAVQLALIKADIQQRVRLIRWQISILWADELGEE